VYWNAAASYYAYLFAQWSLLGVDVLGESQFVGYPELAELNLAPQYPSVAMVDWNSGNGTARYWILKLLLDELAVGQGMMNTTVVPAPASVTNPFCGDIINLANLTLACTTPGAVIDAIQFASYGTPNGDGTCGDWSVGACNAANSTAIVESYCLGQSSCVVPATTPIFGDPCYGAWCDCGCRGRRCQRQPARNCVATAATTIIFAIVRPHPSPLCLQAR